MDARQVGTGKVRPRAHQVATGQRPVGREGTRHTGDPSGSDSGQVGPGKVGTGKIQPGQVGEGQVAVDKLRPRPRVRTHSLTRNIELCGGCLGTG